MRKCVRCTRMCSCHSSDRGKHSKKATKITLPRTWFFSFLIEDLQPPEALMGGGCFGHQSCWHLPEKYQSELVCICTHGTPLHIPLTMVSTLAVRLDQKYSMQLPDLKLSEFCLQKEFINAGKTLVSSKQHHNFPSAQSSFKYLCCSNKSPRIQKVT